LHVTFSTPVYHVVVEGSGAFRCDGTFGLVRAVTVHGDTIVTPFSIITPDDCGSDTVAAALRATIATDSGIASLVIEEMLPRTWAIAGPPFVAGSYMTYAAGFDHWKRCPPVVDTLFESYINDPKLRAGLTEAWNNSNPDTAGVNRHERGGFLYRDPIADTTFYVLTPNALDTPCRSVNTPPNSPSVTWLVAEFHTHPFKDYEVLPKSPGCGNPKSRTAQRYDAVVHGGPSFLPNDSVGGGGDWPRSVKNDRLPMYIMDKQYIYETDTTKHDSTSWGPGAAKKWPRMTSSCFLF
jgi:hypothetical protein